MSTPPEDKYLVVLNGESPSEKLLRETAATAGTIVAADGAANALRGYGIAPDFIVGDLDSVTDETLAAFPDAEVVRIAEQETTDGDKAIRFALERGAREMVVLGAGGGRIDRTLSNLGIVRKYSDRAQIALVDDYCRAVVVSDTLTFPAQVGQEVSIVPVGAAARVSTRGLRWELADEVLELGVRESISNVAVAAEVTVSVGSGFVGVFVFQ